MSKKQTLWAAALVALAFQAVTVASAFGLTVEWLTFNGGQVLKAEPVRVHTAFTLVHEGGTTGNLSIECHVVLAGTAGPLSEDAVAGLESLTCKVLNLGICETLSIAPAHMPWKTTLVYEGTTGWDGFSSSGAGEPEWELRCKLRFEIGPRQIFCNAKFRFAFNGNTVNGATFLWKGAESNETACSDGGKSRIEQPSGTDEQALGFDVS